MTERRVAIHNPEAGPSSLPGSRTASPNPDGDGIGTLQRPASHGRLSRLMVPNRSRRGSNASQQDSPITAYAEDGSVSSGRTTPEQRKRTGKGEWSIIPFLHFIVNTGLIQPLLHRSWPVIPSTRNMQLRSINVCRRSKVSTNGPTSSHSSLVYSKSVST